MKEFTQEMLDKLTTANESVKGTVYYHTYHMQGDIKTNGRWRFLGHGIPNTTGEIKTIKLTTYIITKDTLFGERRWTVNLNVKDLLNI